MNENYSYFDCIDAINRIEGQLECGYVDVGMCCDDIELHVIAEALKLYKEKLKKEND